MVIVASQTPATPHAWKKPLLAVSFLAGLALLLVPVAAAIVTQTSPTGTYLSPLPEKQLAAEPTPTTTLASTELTASQSILSAQAFLEKAITLSQNPTQTEADREEIVTLLNESLKLANQAVALAPNAPQSYLMRARILSSSSSLRPDATLLAQKDLEAAQALANGQSVTLPTNIDLLNLSPKQRAEGEGQLVIAAPAESEVKESTGSAQSNTYKLSDIIASGEQEVTLEHAAITAESYLYLIPRDSGRLVYLKAKGAGEAVVATDRPAETDLEFEYWIVTP